MSEDDSSNEEKPNIDEVSAQILEYYRNYSQTKKLPKYFSGATATSIKPDDWDEHYRKRNTSVEVQGIVFQAKPTSVVVESIEDSFKSETGRVPSPASSVTSNRKLEWDYGADIGYDNYSLQKKSNSLPSISMLHDANQKEFLSSDSDENQEFNRQRDHSVLQRIGLPAAESTGLYPNSPKDDNRTNKTGKRKQLDRSGGDTSRSVAENNWNTWPTGQRRTDNSGDGNVSPSADGDRELIYLYEPQTCKVVNLCVTKPISVECVGEKCTEDKDVQVLVDNVSVAIQTERIQVKSESNSKKGQQTIIYIEHKDGKMDIRQSSFGPTDSDPLVSKCNSFEYLSGEEYNRTGPKSSTGSSRSAISEKSDKTDKQVHSPERCKAGTSNEEPSPITDTTTDTDKSEKNGLSPKTSKTSYSEPLGKLISKQQRQELNTDFERSIALIQKLMKSTRYDEVTKKHYLKKIMQKMIDQHNSDTSEVSLDPSDSGKQQQSKMNEITPQSSATNQDTSLTSDVLKSPQTERDVEAYKEKKLQENIPWFPAERLKARRQPQLQAHTFVEEIKPTLIEDGKKTKSDNKKSVDVQKKESGVSNKSKNSKTYGETKGCLCPVSSKPLKSNRRKHWKEQKTISEQLLEMRAKTKTVDEHLVDLARSERLHQLHWINAEISHLNKLKRVLAKKSSASSSKESTGTDMKSTGRSKKATVYLVTTERSDTSLKESQSSIDKEVYVLGLDRFKKDGLGSSTTALRTSSEQSPVNDVFTFKDTARSAKATVHRIPISPTDLDAWKNRPVLDLEDGNQPPAICPMRMMNHCVGCCIGSTRKENVSCLCTSYRMPTKTSGTNPDPIVPQSVGRGSSRASLHLESHGTSPEIVPVQSNFTCTTCKEKKKIVIKNPCVGTETGNSQDKDVQSCIADNKMTQCQHSFGDLTDTGSSPSGDTFRDTVCNCCKRNVAPRRNVVMCQGCGGQYHRRSEEKITSKKTKEGGKKKDGLLTEKNVEVPTIENAPIKQTIVAGREEDKIVETKTYHRSGTKVSDDDSDQREKTRDLKNQGERFCYKKKEFVFQPFKTVEEQMFYEKNGAKSSNFVRTEVPLTTFEGRVIPVQVDSDRSGSGDGNRQTIIPVKGDINFGQEKSDNEKEFRKVRDDIPDEKVTQYTKQTKEVVSDMNDLRLNECFGKSGHKHEDPSKKSSPRDLDAPKDQKDVIVKKPVVEIRPKSATKADTAHEENETKEKPKPLNVIETEPEAMNKQIRVKEFGEKEPYTLQEYLLMNRPSFIQSAEERRKCLIELAYLREKRCAKYKQLLAKTKGLPIFPNGENERSSTVRYLNRRKHLFSTMEMKQITAKHYKKLPEVQKRLHDNREAQIRVANRILADMFNKRLRDWALKGKVDLSTSVSVINFT